MREGLTVFGDGLLVADNAPLLVEAAESVVAGDVSSVVEVASKLRVELVPPPGCAEV